MRGPKPDHHGPICRLLPATNCWSRRTPDASLHNCRSRWSRLRAHTGQDCMDLRHDRRALANPGGHALDRLRANIPDGEDAVAAGLQGPLRILAREHDPLVVELDAPVEPRRIWVCADEQK